MNSQCAVQLLSANCKQREMLFSANEQRETKAVGVRTADKATISAVCQTYKQGRIGRRSGSVRISTVQPGAAHKKVAQQITDTKYGTNK